MRIGITVKIVVLVVACVVIASLAVLVAAKFAFERGFTKEYDATILAYANVGQERLDAMRTQLLALAKAQAVRPNVIAGLASGDGALLSRLAKDRLEAGGIAAIVFLDAAEKPVVGVGEATGLAEVLAARREKLRAGGETVGFAPVGADRLPLLATAPVHKDAALIGTVCVVAEPAAGNAWVDGIKKTLHAEATIFSGTRRISSTITENGRRVIGTTIDNAEVKAQVFDRNKTAIERIALFGQDYMGAYWPLTDASGKPVGIGFVGKSMHQLSQSLTAANRSAGLSALIVVVVLAGLGFAFSKVFTRPIHGLARFAASVAGGQLDAPLTVAQNDEVGDLAQALRRMVATLRDTIIRAQAATDQANEASAKAQAAQAAAEEARHQGEAARREGVLQAAARLSEVVDVLGGASDALRGRIDQSRQGAQLQSRRVNETATAMEEISATVLTVARNAAEAAATADGAKTKAEQGAGIVTEAVSRIAAVRDQALVMKTDMGSLGDRARDIGAVIGVINDIADQTNLLALNAAIEAARAGEAGRGFAVVADEVRKLAEKTMIATKEVGEAIGGIQRGTQANVDNVIRVVAIIAEATAKAQESGQALDAIVSLVETASDQVRAIATATEEQSASTEEISRSIEEINTISAQTSASMAEANQAVADLAGQATALVELIATMRREAAATTGSPQALSVG